MTIRVLLADDEPLARRGIRQLLARHRDCRVVAVCRDGREAVRALRETEADVAFLDIQMPGLDAFAVLERADPGSRPAIVFVTAHDEFAVRAFEERALDYLLKPVSQARFDVALERVRERLRTAAALEESGARGTLDSIIVPTRSGDLVVAASEIDWIEADDYYAALHVGGRRHLVRESLASLEHRLDPHHFVRVHRSAIVRLDRVRELRHGGGAVVVLRDGTCIPVSRRRREQVCAAVRGRR